MCTKIVAFTGIGQIESGHLVFADKNTQAEFINSQNEQFIGNEQKEPLKNIAKIPAKR